jgi:hypothetical protein
MIAKKLTYGRGLDPTVAQSVAGICWGVKGGGLDAAHCCGCQQRCSKLEYLAPLMPIPPPSIGAVTWRWSGVLQYLQGEMP